MGALILVLFLLMMQRASGPTSSDATPDHTSGDAPPKGGGGLGDIVADVLPVLPGLLGGLGGLGGGGGAAGAAAGGGALGTTGTVGGGTGSVGGGAGTGSIGGSIGGSVGGSIGSSLVGPITVGLLANPAMWAIYILIASKVVQAQENDKDFQSQLFALNVNARGLHSFEQSLTRRILETRGLVELVGDQLPFQIGRQPNTCFRVLQQRDARLDQYLTGSRVTLQGWRSTYQFPWQPGDETLFRKARYLALEYLRLRASHGYRMLKYWKPDVNVPASWGFATQPFDTLQTMYEDRSMPGNMPGLGGLLHIPLAAAGETQSPRSDNDAYPNDPRQLRPPTFDAEPINDVTPAELQAVRVAALLEAVHVVRWDARPLIDLNASVYAQDVLNALAAPGATRYASNGDLMTPGPRTPLEGVHVNGGLLVLDPSVFGTVYDEASRREKTIAIDAQAIRQTDFGNTRPKVVLL